MSYPKTKQEASHILDMVRVGCGEMVSQHLIRYCLLMTGDLT